MSGEARNLGSMLGERVDRGMERGGLVRLDIGVYRGVVHYEL